MSRLSCKAAAQATRRRYDRRDSLSRRVGVSICDIVGRCPQSPRQCPFGEKGLSVHAGYSSTRFAV